MAAVLQPTSSLKLLHVLGCIIIDHLLLLLPYLHGERFPLRAWSFCQQHLLHQAVAVLPPNTAPWLVAASQSFEGG